MKKTKYVPVNEVYDLIKTVFIKTGVPLDDAKICSDILIAADLSGIESHGIGRLYYYYDRIKAGVHKTRTKINIIRDKKAIAVWDGKHGMGHVVAYRAMQTAIEKAKNYGMGSVAVRNSTHFGIAGYYPKMAAEQNMIGMTFTNARPAISPTFGTRPMLGTNPIAFGAPSDLDFPFLFDAATSITQRGKIEVLKRENKPMPEGWAIDKEGNPFLDTNQFLNDLVSQNASFLPLGGADEIFGSHKGYSLAVIVEILSSALQAGNFMHGLHGMDNGKRVPYRLGHFFMAIDIESFTEISEFKKITGEIMRQLQDSPKVAGKDRIFVAGEKEYLKEKEIRKNGIPVNPALQKDIRIMLDELEISGFDF